MATDHDIESLWERLDTDRGRLSLEESILSFLTEDTTDVDTELIDEISRRLGQRAIGTFPTPVGVRSLIADLISESGPKSIIDPMCGTGALLHGVVRACRPETVHGIEINRSLASIAQRLLGDNAQVVVGNTFSNPGGVLDRYDAVVCESAFGARLSSPYSLEVEGSTMK